MRTIRDCLNLVCEPVRKEELREDEVAAARENHNKDCVELLGQEGKGSYNSSIPELSSTKSILSVSLSNSGQAKRVSSGHVEPPLPEI